MTYAGERLIAGAKEALLVAAGEQPAACLHINGHSYVPEASLAGRDARIAELEKSVEELTNLITEGVTRLTEAVSALDRAETARDTAFFGLQARDRQAALIMGYPDIKSALEAGGPGETVFSMLASVFAARTALLQETLEKAEVSETALSGARIEAERLTGALERIKAAGIRREIINGERCTTISNESEIARTALTKGGADVPS